MFKIVSSDINVTKFTLMKIGFPVLEKASENEIMLDKSLHRSKLFGVFCTQTHNINIVQSDKIPNNDNGMGIINFLKDEHITQIISPECFSMAAKYFNDNNINVYQAIGTSVMENITSLSKGLLNSFNADSAKQNKKCGSSCSSCDSTCDEINQEVVSI